MNELTGVYLSDPENFRDAVLMALRDVELEITYQVHVGCGIHPEAVYHPDGHWITKAVQGKITGIRVPEGEANDRAESAG
jgi:hypothetical protein